MSSVANAQVKKPASWKVYALKAGSFVGAVATLVTSVATAAYIVAPQFQPRNELGATIGKISVGHEVTITRDMAQRNGLRNTDEDFPHEGLTDPRQSGIQILVNAKFMAYKNRSYVMRAELYEAETLRQIRPSDERSFYRFCDERSPKANVDAGTWLCWHSAPEPGTKYFVRATLYDMGPIKRLPIELPGLDLPENEDSQINLTRDALNFADSEIFTVPSFVGDEGAVTVPGPEALDNMPVKPEVPAGPPFESVN